jgi:hypothetical protein
MVRMRTQEQREEQTLAIGSAVFVAALLWFAPLVVVAAVAGRFGALDAAMRVAFPVAFVAFVVTVVVRLRARSRRAR